MTKCLCFLLILLIQEEVVGRQLPSVDSLKTVLSSSQGGDRIQTLNLLATRMRETEQEEAFQYALEAEKLAHAAGDIAAESQAKENIGWVYYRRGRWQRAFDYTKDAYELANQVNDTNIAARLMNTMGALYYEQHNFDQAIIQFKKAYVLSKQNKDLYTQIRSLNNVAFNFSQKKEYDSALYYARFSIETNKKAGSPYLTAFANRVIGDIYYDQGKYDSAASIFKNSLQDARVQKVKTTEASVTHRLGAAYIKLGMLDAAESVLKEGIIVSSENNFLDELAKNHKFLAKVYEEKGQIRKAFEHQSTYLILNDSLVNTANNDRIALMQGMFQENLDKSELNLLKEQNENQAQRLKLIRRNNLIVGIAIVLICGLVIWLFILNRNIKKYNKYLLEQKEQIKIQNKDLEAKSNQLESINETKNKLFSILGHDLKGPVGQVKAVVDLMMQGMLSKEEFDQLLFSLNKNIDTVFFTLNNTLKWSMAQMEGFKLKKKVINLRGIVDNTLVLLEPSLNEKNIQIHNSMADSVKAFADPDLMEVVVRNILNNAVKFSESNQSIEISNSYDEKGFTKWCVLDHGIGMDKQQIQAVLAKDYTITNSQKGTNQEKGSGLGLQLCKEFIRMNGGEIFITSSLNKGTKICVTIPDSRSVSQGELSGNKEILQS